MRNGKRQEIDVANLPGSRQAATVHCGIVEQTDVVSDKLVIGSGHSITQSLHGFGDAQRVRVRGLGEDAYASVLDQRTRCPPLFDMADEPIGYCGVVSVVLIKQSD